MWRAERCAVLEGWMWTFAPSGRKSFNVAAGMKQQIRLIAFSDRCRREVRPQFAGLIGVVLKLLRSVAALAPYLLRVIVIGSSTARWAGLA